MCSDRPQIIDGLYSEEDEVSAHKAGADVYLTLEHKASDIVEAFALRLNKVHKPSLSKIARKTNQSVEKVEMKINGKINQARN